MKKAKPDFLTILRVLAAHEVQFIVVGGVSAVLQGAPISTFDLDVVHARSPENVGRLLSALQELDGSYREQPERRLRPDRSHLESPGHQLLLTNAGPLDLLGALGGGRGYEELVDRTDVMTVGNISVKVLHLTASIELKEELGRDKDRAVLAILKRTVEETRKHRKDD